MNTLQVLTGKRGPEYIDSILGTDLAGDEGFPGDSATESIGKYAGTLADIAQRLFEQTQPMRTSIIGRGEQFLGPEGFDVSTSPVWSPSRNVLEEQYNVARENIISGMPRGGQLPVELRELEETRAQGLGDLAGRIATDEYNKIYGLATGVPGQAIRGMAGAGNIVAQQAIAQATQQVGKSQMYGDVGQGIGTMMAAKGGGK